MIGEYTTGAEGVVQFTFGRPGELMESETLWPLSRKEQWSWAEIGLYFDSIHLAWLKCHHQSRLL
jgi:hypothetical protein